MVGLLDPRQGDGTYVENRPSRGQLLWGILEPYVMGPVNAWQGLRDADLNTLLYDTGPRAQQAVENSFNVAGTVAGGSSVVPKPDDALNMGIKAFHGSPHDFDRFSLDKIGTGEGAQAYGHGLYFAENEGIARSYRDGLSAAKRPVWPDDPAVAEKIKSNTARANYLADQQQYASSQSEWDSISDKLAAIEDENRSLLGTKGHMYEVEINADPNDFLDWDKPLSEQPGFLKSLTNYDPDYNVDYEERLGRAFQSLQPVSEPLGQDFYAELARGNKKGAATMLKSLGVPGIKYLDAGSRGAGDGTRNYVVFDDNLINIIRKYGIAGLLGGSAALNAMTAEPQEQY